jgi:hypothetical protein
MDLGKRLGVARSPGSQCSVGSELPLVARNAELRTLTTVIDAVPSGSGGVALITGEAGIGKTRLLQEARREADLRGLLVLRGRALESGGAYRPLVEAFARPAAAFAQDPGLVGVRPTLARVFARLDRGRGDPGPNGRSSRCAGWGVDLAVAGHGAGWICVDHRRPALG